MTPFQIIAALVTLSAIGAYINHRYFGFPQTIGLMAFAFAVSLVAIILSRTGIANLESLGRVVGSIDFSDVLLHGMLSFLLFAGAMQINLEELKNVR
jgi:CPA1 family monovalent cation:H+ antiporter